jgi:hypothetical protein
MVEEIIKKHLETGYFIQQREGVVYEIDAGIRGINGKVEHECGLNLLKTTAFIQESRRLGVDRAFVVAGDRYGNSRSVMSLLMLDTPYGAPVSLVANHDTPPETLLRLYRVLTGNGQ